MVNRFKEQSKDYELSLEQELEEAEERQRKCLIKIDKLEEEVQMLRNRFQRDQAEIARLQKEMDGLRVSLKRFEERRRELEDLNDQWESSTRVLEYSNKDLEERLYHAEESMIMYKEELDEVTNLKESEMQRLRDEVKDLKNELTILEKQHGDASKIAELEIALKKLEREKFELRNKLEKSKTLELDMSTSVNVFVKVRPFLSHDANKVLGLTSTPNSVTLLSYKDKQRQVPSKLFEFEKVFGSTSSLDDIFHELLTSIQHFIAGGTCCIMSYGQTGSGKTYTMSGLINKTLDLLSSILSPEVKLSFHCIEVYNEQVRNLLSDSPLSKNWKDIISISKIQLQTDWYKSIKKHIQEASGKRVTKPTDCNEQSSRSHCIYSIFLSSRDRKGVIQFVDLAGSERISKSSVTGDTLKEVLHINKSLSALQDVISALESKNSHVPYRNSLLTRILKLSLSAPSSKVSVILNCSPTEESLNETLSTLTLGQRLKSIDLSWAIRKNLKSEEVSRTLDLLEKERSEKINLLRKLEKLERDLEAYTNVVKEKDLKINNLASKLKLIEKAASEEIEALKKGLMTTKSKYEDLNKKFIITKSQAEHEKSAKAQALRALKSRDSKPKKSFSSTPEMNISKLYSVSNPKLEQKSMDLQKSGHFSRIPKPGNASCNTSKINIVL